MIHKLLSLIEWIIALKNFTKNGLILYSENLKQFLKMPHLENSSFLKLIVCLINISKIKTREKCLVARHHVISKY